MQREHYIILGYLLTFIGYMTLTISLPLLSAIANHHGISYSDTQYGVSILFFMFSLSAIILSSLSDRWGAYNVLKYAQLLSIFGLWLLFFSRALHDFFLGCFCVGFGTGCYSSNARALISRQVSNEIVITKAFANLSILVVIAPIASFYLAIWMSDFNWRFAYAAMALLEMMLLFYALWVLSHERMPYGNEKKCHLLVGFVDCLKQKKFFLNMCGVGLGVSIFMQLFMVNIRALLVGTQSSPVAMFEFIILGMSVMYIVGVLLFRKCFPILSGRLIRAISMLILLLGIIIFSLTHSIGFMVLGIYLVCISTGFLIPFLTSSGMGVIEQHHGAAAALLTFSFASISGIWSMIQAHLLMMTKSFVDVGLWVSWILLVLVCFFVENKSLFSRNHGRLP